ncbi:hypothetical protein BGZ94_008443, partial [Podila epigama]
MSRSKASQEAKDESEQQQHQRTSSQTTAQTQANIQAQAQAQAPRRDSLPPQTTVRRNSVRQVEEPGLDEREMDEAIDQAKRLKLASAILFVCILSFVLQTELTKFVQTSMGYHKPYFILYISHSFWAIVLPFQFFYTTYLSRSRPRNLATLQDKVDYFGRLIRQSTSCLINRKDEYDAVQVDSPRASMSPAPPSASSSPSMAAVMAGPPAYLTTFSAKDRAALRNHLFWVVFGMTTLFMVPSYLWYFCVTLTSMANLTAIYNTACFFAYIFSIVLLKEKIVRNKVIAVVLSLVGVAIIGLTTKNPEEDASAMGKVRWVGDVLSLIGAALYGFEEVMYKKYASPKIHSVTFANTMTGLMGVVTCLMLWIPIPILHVIGHEVFELPKKNEMLSILMIATLGLVYNGCFMIVVSQTSPVFAAVGVMATIPLVALTDWVVFRDTIGWGNIVGGISILVG